MRMTIEERRGRLVAATLALIAREGVSGATARAIVKEADMPLGALHYAFPTMDALLEAAADAVTDHERLAIERSLASASSTLAGSLEAGMVGYVTLLIADPARELAFLELMLHASRARLAGPPSPGRYAASHALVEQLLIEAAERHAVTWATEPALLARHTVAMLDGITTGWLADHDDDAAYASARFHAAAITAQAIGPEEEQC